MNFEDDDDLYQFSNKYEDCDSLKKDEANDHSYPGSTVADSDEDYENHFDAIDELAEIFDSSSKTDSDEVKIYNAPFERPSNPVCNDTQFYLPRCSAPAPSVNHKNPEDFMRMPEFAFSIPSRFYKEDFERSINIKGSTPTVNNVGNTKGLFATIQLSCPAFGCDDK